MELRELEYKTKIWEIHEKPIGDIDTPPIVKNPHEQLNVIVCNSDSEKAKTADEDANVFYINLELASIGIDPTRGGFVTVLSDDWHGSKKGALVMCIHKGVGKKPTANIWAIQKIALDHKTRALHM